MSESVSNAKVEDVLASIRRLVSEERRPPREQSTAIGEAAGMRAEPDAGPATVTASDRLVLTPSFRVSEIDIIPEDWRVDAEDEAARPGHGHLPPDRKAIDDAGQVQSAAAGSDMQGRTGDAEEDDRSGVLRLDETVRLPEDAAEASEMAEAAGPADRVAPEPSAASPVDSNDVDGIGIVDTDASDGEASSDMAGTAAAERPEDDRTDGRPAGSAGVSTLGAKIAALEAAIARKQDTREPDGLAGDDYSGTNPPAMNRDADAAREPLRLEPELRSDDPPADMPAHDREGEVSGEPIDGDSSVPSEEIVDEAALRDLVAEIVREELSGELGERITRNVRKLVRREIQRALIAKDFD